MKKLLATTAIAMIAMASAASAQSVLERVLTSLDASTTTALNGTFANIAENIGSGQSTLYVDTTGNSYTEAEWTASQLDIDQADYSTAVTSGDYVNTTTGEVVGSTSGRFANAAAATAAGFVAAGTNTHFSGTSSTDAEFTVITAAEKNALPGTYTVPVLADVVVSTGLIEGVNGSINNAIEGITSAIVTASQVATAGGTTAYQFDLPTYDLGALSTTALGAVNTGTITLGVNSTVDDAKTSSTQAVSSVMSQLGGSTDTGAIVLNVASNMTGVNGSINNTMNNVNGAMASATTTALGAVNTGIITSGVNAAVQGIVGTSGQTNGVAP